MMKRLNIVLIGIAMLLCSITKLYAQPLPFYSQYMTTKFLVNPATAGALGSTVLELTAREQWLGFKGTPKTHTLSFHTRLMKKNFSGAKSSARRRYTSKLRAGRIGVGAYVFNDRSGLLDYSGGLLAYSYHIRMRNQQLSFGLSLSAFQLKLDQDRIILYDQVDDFLTSNKLTLYVPDASVGVYYAFTRFYAGVSAAQLMQSSLKYGTFGSSSTKMLRHYYLMAGYKYEIDKKIDIEPSFLYKTNEKLQMQTDINVRGYYKNDYWVGVTYRTGGRRIEDSRNNGAVILMGGVMVNKFEFAYAFDYSLTAIQKYTYGSHEFFISYHIGDNARRYRWLQRY